MLPRWQGGLATAVVTAVAVVLVVLDSADRSVARWWSARALTTDTVAGLLVLALTLLVVDQVLSRRQLAERSRVIAAQAGIVLAQARRSVKAVLEMRDKDGDRAPAVDELRTYMLMLLVGAPVLIEDPVARTFLERAQSLAAEVGRVLSPSEVEALAGRSREGGLDQAIDLLRTAAAPLLEVLTSGERTAVNELSD